MLSIVLGTDALTRRYCRIVLIGFSRGAFTARSIAGLISDIGLLTRSGMRDFFAIFKDSSNRHNDKYYDM